MKYVSEQSLELLKFVPQKVSSQEYGYATTNVKEHVQIEEHRIQKLQEDHIDPTLKLQQQEEIISKHITYGVTTTNSSNIKSTVTTVDTSHIRATIIRTNNNILANKHTIENIGTRSTTTDFEHNRDSTLILYEVQQAQIDYIVVQID